MADSADQTEDGKQCDICGMKIAYVLKADASKLLNSDKPIRICNTGDAIRVHHVDRSNGYQRDSQ